MGRLSSTEKRKYTNRYTVKKSGYPVGTGTHSTHIHGISFARKVWNMFEMFCLCEDDHSVQFETLYFLNRYTVSTWISLSAETWDNQCSGICAIVLWLRYDFRNTLRGVHLCAYPFWPFARYAAWLHVCWRMCFPALPSHTQYNNFGQPSCRCGWWNVWCNDTFCYICLNKGVVDVSKVFHNFMFVSSSIYIYRYVRTRRQRHLWVQQCLLYKFCLPDLDIVL